jgi:hypothetical protein
VTTGHWTALGTLATIAALILTSVPLLVSRHEPTPAPTAPPPTVTPTPSESAGPVRSSPVGVTKAAYLAHAERICQDNRQGITAPPDRNFDPRAFGRWLSEIATSNADLFDMLTGLPRPTADVNLLGELFAERQHVQRPLPARGRRIRRRRTRHRRAVPRRGHAQRS